MLSLAVAALARLAGKPEFAGKNTVELDSGSLHGEVSVLRFLAKSNKSLYGSGDVVAECENDLWVDWCVNGSFTLEALNAALKDRIYLAGVHFGLADVVAWAYLTTHQERKVGDDAKAIKRWIKTVESRSELLEAKK